MYYLEIPKSTAFKVGETWVKVNEIEIWNNSYSLSKLQKMTVKIFNVDSRIHQSGILFNLKCIHASKKKFQRTLLQIWISLIWTDAHMIWIRLSGCFIPDHGQITEKFSTPTIFEHFNNFKSILIHFYRFESTCCLWPSITL